MRSEMLTVFCYDISDNKIRRSVSKILESNAVRVQYSVFETRMTELNARRICTKIATKLKDGDSLRVYVMGKNGEKRTQVFGDGPPVSSSSNYWLA